MQSEYEAEEQFKLYENISEQPDIVNQLENYEQIKIDHKIVCDQNLKLQNELHLQINGELNSELEVRNTELEIKLSQKIEEIE